MITLVFLGSHNMLTLKRLLGSLCVLVFSSTLFAAPKAWVSTSYRPDFWSSGSWYRAPVTDGYMDLRLAIENATFDQAEFSISYDSSILYPLSDGNFMDIMPGLSVSSATINLDGTWKKTTFTLTGAVSIGSIQYESEAVFRLRLYPRGEGTVPISLWTSSSPRYPASYKSCDLILRSDGQVVPYERKEWNDSVQLVTFTDKTSASVLYYYDLNLGTPISNGIIRITYADSSVEEFTASNHARGITIDSDYGGYFITDQPNAIEYAIVFPEYEDTVMNSISGGWSTTHIQPERMFFVREASEGFHGLRATSDDIVLTVDLMGIGADFGSSVYDAVLTLSCRVRNGAIIIITMLCLPSMRMRLETFKCSTLRFLFRWLWGLSADWIWMTLPSLPHSGRWNTASGITIATAPTAIGMALWISKTLRYSLIAG